MFKKVVLGYIFIRPFISDIAFEKFDLALTIIFIIISFLCLFKYRKQIRFIPLERGFLTKFTTLDKLISIFSISLLISLLSSNNILNSLNCLHKYISSIILFYTIKQSGPENKKQLMVILLISAVLVSLCSLRCLFVVSKTIFRYLSKQKTDSFFIEEFLTRKRAFFPFLSPNLLANYLVMIIMFCLGIIFTVKSRGSRPFKIPASPVPFLSTGFNNLSKERNLFILSLFCIVLSITTLIFTKSVGGWVILTSSSVIFFLSAKKLNIKTVFTIFLILLITVGVFLLRSQGESNFIKPSFSMAKRISYWKETINLIYRYPLTGVGLGNFSLKETIFAHNSYLQIWAEVGLLGILSWLGIIFVFLKNNLEELSSSRNKFFYAGLLGSGSAFLLHNIFDFSFFSSQVSFLWWIILALNEDTSKVSNQPKNAFTSLK